MNDTQLQAIAAALRAEADAAVVAALSIRDDVTLADWLNADSTFVVWRSLTPTNELANAINWSAFTPADAADGTQLWLNRAMACQGKQFNIQNLLLAAQGQLASGLPNIRQALNDALTNIPAGAGGAMLSAAWAAVRTLMQRPARRVERIFATGAGTSATPGVLVVEGAASITDVSTALNRF